SLAGAAIACSAAAPAPAPAPMTPQHALFTLPDAAALAAAIGLVAGPGHAFAVGDNVDGYLDAATGGYRQRPGYFNGATVRLQDVATTIDGRLLDRRAADAVQTVLPGGWRTTLAGPEGTADGPGGMPVGASETLVLHAGSRRLSVVVTSPQPSRLAVQPLWAFDIARAATSWHHGVLALAPPGAGLQIAIAADRPFGIVFGGGYDGSPRLQALQRGRTFTLHIAFAPTSAAAVAAAAAMARDPGLVARSLAAERDRLTRSWLWTSDHRYDRALVWAKASGLSFLVDEYGLGLWAGLPWFRQNWGRDTFISLPGILLVSGHFDAARRVIENFARYQDLKRPDAAAPAASAVAADAPVGPRASDYGRIPNRVSGDEIIYNTVDGTPWMLREALEYVRYTGDRAFAAQMVGVARAYIEGALAHAVDADGLLTHDDADTWMDARIAGRQAWSPRGSRAVEIQALWYQALLAAARLADIAGEPAPAQAWRAQAQRTRASFLRLFWDGRTMADRLRRDGSRDLAVRPNQLLLLTVPDDDFVPPAVGAAVLRNATRELLFPYGIASLSPHDPNFHPHHVDDAHYNKDAAYHNGTIWGWNAGFTVTALTRYGRQDLAYALSRNLAQQILGLGTLGTMSELLDALPDAQGRPHPSGAWSQAWSVAEFERNAYQDYLGFRPDLTRNRLRFVPALPAAWRHFDARLPYGAEARGEALEIAARRHGAVWQWTLELRHAAAARELVFDYLTPGHARRRAAFTLAPGRRARVEFDAGGLRLDGRPLASTLRAASQDAVIGALRFAVPPRDDPQAFPVTRGKDVLQRALLAPAAAPALP
ncbi:MAG: hypothetical protein KGL18_04555, partial [Burkholderiales bacterium]|nr:hypothetical protein [Burkholderiales bacterium]